MTLEQDIARLVKREVVQRRPVQVLKGLAILGLVLFAVSSVNWFAVAGVTSCWIFGDGSDTTCHLYLSSLVKEEVARCQHYGGHCGQSFYNGQWH